MDYAALIVLVLVAWFVYRSLSDLVFRMVLVGGFLCLGLGSAGASVTVNLHNTGVGTAYCAGFTMNAGAWARDVGNIAPGGTYAALITGDVSSWAGKACGGYYYTNSGCASARMYGAAVTFGGGTTVDLYIASGGSTTNFCSSAAVINLDTVTRYYNVLTNGHVVQAQVPVPPGGTLRMNGCDSSPFQVSIVRLNDDMAPDAVFMGVNETNSPADSEAPPYSLGFTNDANFFLSDSVYSNLFPSGTRNATLTDLSGQMAVIYKGMLDQGRVSAAEYQALVSTLSTINARVTSNQVSPSITLSNYSQVMVTNLTTVQITNPAPQITLTNFLSMTNLIAFTNDMSGLSNALAGLGNGMSSMTNLQGQLVGGLNIMTNLEGQLLLVAKGETNIQAQILEAIKTNSAGAVDIGPITNLLGQILGVDKGGTNIAGQALDVAAGGTNILAQSLATQKGISNLLSDLPGTLSGLTNKGPESPWPEAIYHWLTNGMNTVVEVAQGLADKASVTNGVNWALGRQRASLAGLSNAVGTELGESMTWTNAVPDFTPGAEEVMELDIPAMALEGAPAGVGISMASIPTKVRLDSSGSAFAVFDLVRAAMRLSCYLILMAMVYRKTSESLKEALLVPQIQPLGQEVAGNNVKIVSAIVVAALVVATVWGLLTVLTVSFAGISGNVASNFAALSSVSTGIAAVPWAWVTKAMPIWDFVACFISWMLFQLVADVATVVAMVGIKIAVGL